MILFSKWLLMKLSNFEWTDKESIRWFIMLHSGHEGPYSLLALKQRHEKKNLSLDTKVWAEGLAEPVSVRTAFDRAVEMPPLPFMDEVVPPPLPEEESLIEIVPEIPVKPTKRSPLLLMVVFLGLVILSFGIFEWLSGQKVVSIRRHSYMDLVVHQKIQNEARFQGWDKKIFFKEYVSSDYRHIWLVNSGFQKCDVEATFRSVDGKLLSRENKKVSFKSRSKLVGHVVDFSSFEFTEGRRVIPGLYEMDISAQNCEWGSLAAKLGNTFSPPDSGYVTRMKIVLYHRGAVEYNSILDRLIQKRLKLQEELKKRDDYFWQSLEEKLQTLQALTLQIETFFIELLDKDSRKFPTTLKEGVVQYTKQFGHGLTSFVNMNEKYFKSIAPAELQRLSRGKDYESLIRLTAKNLGLESMKIIEMLQKLQKPRRVKLAVIQEDIRKIFGKLKVDINQKLIETSADRSL